MLNLIGDGITKGAKKALTKATKEAGEEVAEKAAKKVGKEIGESISKKASKINSAKDIAEAVASKYGNKADEIMAYYGGDIGKSAKSAQNSFLGKVLTGQPVEDPLVMYHSVDSDKLSKMLDIADETYSDYAIPNPSVQVVDPAKNIGSRYGDVILLGNKSIPGGINKYSGMPDLYGKYNLFSRDIYSPRKPNITYSKGTPIIEGTRKIATPNNISDYMTKQGVKAVESNWSTPASLAATTSKKFKSPLDAIKNSDLLQSQGGLQRAFNDWDKEVSDSVQTLLDRYMVDNPDVNPYSYSDYIMSELQDSMAGKRGWDDPYGINTTEEGRNIVNNLTSKAKELPTAYFEGKPTRAVPLKEFGGAILPKDYNNQRILQALKDSGIDVKGFYDPENYEETLQNTLVGLTKASDRLDTPYLMSLEPNGFVPDYDTRQTIDSLANSVKRVGSKDVAPVNKSTLPVGWDMLEKRMDPTYIDNEIMKLAGKKNMRDVTPADMQKILDDLGYEVDPDLVATEKALGTYDPYQVLYNTVTDALDDQLAMDAAQEGGELAKEFLSARSGVMRNKFAGPEYFYFGPEGRAGYLDAEFSDRLGIGLSNTPHSDDLNNYVAKDAAGDFFGGGIGIKPNPLRRGEDEVSTAAHERLHSFQSTSKGYDKGVQEAYNKLHEELAPYKLNKKQIKDYHGKLHGSSNLDYYLNDHEQEARMLQEYLDRAGYTKAITDRDKARRRFVAGRSEEFDAGIDKAFDHFFDKLRALSKQGIALPVVGLGTLLGGGAIMGSNKKENG